MARIGIQDATGKKFGPEIPPDSSGNVLVSPEKNISCSKCTSTFKEQDFLFFYSLQDFDALCAADLKVSHHFGESDGHFFSPGLAQ